MPNVLIGPTNLSLALWLFPPTCIWYILSSPPLPPKLAQHPWPVRGSSAPPSSLDIRQSSNSPWPNARGTVLPNLTLFINTLHVQSKPADSPGQGLSGIPTVSRNMCQALLL